MIPLSRLLVPLAVWPGINANLRQCPIVIARIILRIRATVVTLLLLTVLAAIYPLTIIPAVGIIAVLVMWNDACSLVMIRVPVAISMGVSVA